MKSTLIPASLATIPIDEITFEKVNEFCEQKRKEDIDLDYKSDFPNHLENLICAFANTQGGIILIGVKEKDRLPICPPVGVEGDEKGLRQRVVNISFDAIYPPVEPEVVTCKLPNQERRVVVVRVNPSRLLHAVENRKRIYIRSLDSNHGYELASLTDLRWLWERREASISLRSSISVSALERSSSPAIDFLDKTKSKWAKFPHLIISIIPIFPQLPIIPNSRDLLDIANSIGIVRSTCRQVDRRVPWHENQWRTISDGICLKARGKEHAAQYVELGHYCHAFFDYLLQILPEPIRTNVDCIYSSTILSSLDISLRFASAFFDSIHFRWPINLHIWLKKVSTRRLHYGIPGSLNTLGLERLSLACPDQSVNLLNEEILANQLSSELDNFMMKSTKSLLWAFGLDWEEAKIKEWLEGHFPNKPS